VAVGGIPSSTTVTALRDNPSAIAETASGAPVVFAGWHPYDKVSIGDGKTGLIYDFAVNGLQASVVTPDFVDGYEYRIIAHLMESNAAATVRLELEAFFATTAAYRRLIYTGDASSLTNQFGYDVEILMTSIGYDATGYTSTTQVLSRARVNFTSGSISAGKVWMFRRREYASSP
jgi:hypothetical protein